MNPGVLLVTGAYYPEMSGAGLQTRALAQHLRGDVDFVVLTTTTDRSLPIVDHQGGIDVFRVFIDPASWWSKLLGTIRFTRLFARAARRFSIVHLHGFSQKSVLLIALARLTGKKVAIKLTSVGHDDARSIRRRGRLAFLSYASADAFFAVSPRFRDAHDTLGLPRDRLHLIPNGVDLDRFQPGTALEREALRRELDVPAQSPLILFVGFFSREKRPHLLFDAWASRRRSAADDSVLVFVGATRSRYYEIDEHLADDIRRKAAALGLADRLRFVEPTRDIERFHRAADIFVLPSVREGMPNALLEAMGCATACIATKIEGVTDVMIQDGANGLLVPPDDVGALRHALETLLENRQRAAELGREARRTVEARYGLERTAAQYLDAYRGLAGV